MEWTSLAATMALTAALTAAPSVVPGLGGPESLLPVRPADPAPAPAIDDLLPGAPARIAVPVARDNLAPGDRVPADLTVRSKRLDGAAGGLRPPGSLTITLESESLRDAPAAEGDDTAGGPSLHDLPEWMEFLELDYDGTDLLARLPDPNGDGRRTLFEADGAALRDLPAPAFGGSRLHVLLRFMPEGTSDLQGDQALLVIRLVWTPVAR